MEVVRAVVSGFVCKHCNRPLWSKTMCLQRYIEVGLSKRGIFSQKRGAEYHILFSWLTARARNTNPDMKVTDVLGARELVERLQVEGYAPSRMRVERKEQLAQMIYRLDHRLQKRGSWTAGGKQYGGTEKRTHPQRVPHLVWMREQRASNAARARLG